MLATFVPFSTLPDAIQKRALALFVSTFGMTIDQAVAQAEAEQQEPQEPQPTANGVRLAQNGAAVYVPSTDPRLAGLDVGHIVSIETLTCSCGKAKCRHVGKAKTFLKKVA